jgi:anhydro-N-acetylmuramic acid kinase
MKHHIENIFRMANKPSRNIIGLMSGTSLDGLDIFYGNFTGSGPTTQVEELVFETIPYTDFIKDKIKEICSIPVVNFAKVAVYNAWLGKLHGEMINDFIARNHIDKNQVDLIASHGQTVFHAPQSMHNLENMPHATLQISDGDHIAMTTGITTICDFRQKHVAAGGEGAPLAIYGDVILFTDPTENRIMLNIGGIANFTHLKSDGDSLVSDIGPGNTLMDAWAKKYFGFDCDKDAAIAKKGKVSSELLTRLLSDTFYQIPFPKSTGPEYFSIQMLENIIETMYQKPSPVDTMTTLNKLTVEIISIAIQSLENNGQTTVYVSGGGIHNPLIMEGLRQNLQNMDIKDTNTFHINPDAKEAILFAILANECVAGKPSTHRPENGLFDISMGKICFPS